MSSLTCQRLLLALTAFLFFNSPVAAQTPSQTPSQTSSGTPAQTSSGTSSQTATGSVATQSEAIALFKASLTYLDQQKWGQAEELLRKVLTLNPSLKPARNNLGIVLVRLGKYQEAIDVLRNLVGEEPNQSSAWATLGGAYQSLGKIPEAVDSYKHYIALRPNDPEIARVKDLVKGLEEEAAKRKLSGDGKPGETYLDAIVANRPKWASFTAPLKVYIPSECTARGYKPNYSTLLHEAFEAWQKASDDFVRFEYVNDRSGANIDCQWTDDTKKTVDLSEGGHAHIENINNVIQHVSIILLTTSARNLPLDDVIVGKLAMHEVGHSLGLAGHSDLRDDIMFYSIDVSQQKGSVSARDILTLKTLYSKKTDEK